jgi:hypothetical protein
MHFLHISVDELPTGRLYATAFYTAFLLVNAEMSLGEIRNTERKSGKSGKKKQKRGETGVTAVAGRTGKDGERPSFPGSAPDTRRRPTGHKPAAA